MIAASLAFLAIASAVIAVVHLLIKVKRELHYYAVATYLAQAAALGSLWLASSGQSRSAIPLANADIGALFVLAPSLYLSGAALLSERPRIDRRDLLHYAAPLAACVLLAAFRDTAIPAALGLASGISMLGYLVATIVSGYGTLRRLEAAARAELKVFLGFSLVLAPFVVLIMIARLALSERCYALGLLGVSADTLAFSFLRLRSPSILAFGIKRRPPALGQAEEGARRARELEERARRLMEEDELFKRQDLTLEGLARAMGTSAGLVSELFNSALGTNFRSFVNDYRLRAVMRDLVEKPEASILDIAFENGFNSKSSFNTLFSRAAGCSPREYRKRRAKEA